MAANDVSFGFKFGIAGVPELQDALKKLPLAVQGKALEGAVRKAADVITQEMRNRAPVRSTNGFKKFSKRATKRRGFGYLKRNVRTQRARASKDSVTYSAGMKNAFKGKLRGAFYAYYQEYGTKHQSAKPFLRPAYEAKKAEALNVMLSTLNQNIIREAKRLRKRVNIKYLTKGK